MTIMLENENIFMEIIIEVCQRYLLKLSLRHCLQIEQTWSGACI
jgi:hypothetical protein